MASIGKAILQKERLKIKEQLFELERKVDFINRYLNDNTETDVQKKQIVLSLI